MPQLVKGSNQHKKIVKCISCNGSGIKNKKSCKKCNESGYVKSTINKKIVAKKKAINEMVDEMNLLNTKFNNKLKIIDKMKSFG